MTRPIVIAGTDTDAGKTVFAAALTGALNRRGGAHYWKPVQAGFDPYEGRMEGDADRAACPVIGTKKLRDSLGSAARHYNAPRFFMPTQIVQRQHGTKLHLI